MIDIIMIFSNLTSFYLKYFDYLIIDKPGSFGSASGFYFMGQKSEKILTRNELLKQFKGL
jgi:hypothetical protein